MSTQTEKTQDSLAGRRARIAELSAKASARRVPQPGVPNNIVERDGFVTIEHATGLNPAEQPGVVLLDNGTTRPKSTDPCPIRAKYPSPQFDHELIANAAVDAIVGESIQFVPVHPHFATLSWTLVRAPAGSRASMQAGRIVADVPGLFVLECVLGGGWVREVLIAAYPSATLDAMVYPPSMGLQRRNRLRAITRDPKVTSERLEAALEGDQVNFHALLGIPAKAPFNPNIYA